ncbi:unnamed protein product [Microthlaspi erraticum]|uniref:Retrotransposon gag domain-containing protein n=1 Tax=Microthlaspi erraticum TaxID=1685480 RepID=A0A6D2HFY5_9BRAS|nr:unnamed protein product [Microthlaspi erraticum]
MSDSDDQEERDNLAAREIALAEQHEDPPDPNAAHDRANDEMPRDRARHNEEFQGKPQENPLEHIDAFEEICGTISAGGAPKEYLKCKLFSFTLTGKALRWVKSLPAQSITTWKEYKVAFLGHFSQSKEQTC